MRRIISFIVFLAAASILPVRPVRADGPTSRTAAASAPSNDIERLRQALRQPLVDPRLVLQQWQAFVLARGVRFVLPTAAVDWPDEADRLRRRVLDEIVFRGVPADWITGPPRIEEAGRIETGQGYVIRKLRYEACPGLWIPALLYEPAAISGKVPVVLNPNGHVGPLGKAIGYKQIRCINLAKRGMLTLNPEWFRFGELAGVGYDHNCLTYLDLCGRSGVSVFYLALQRGLDVLLAHPNADPDRTAVTGLSGGGWQTIFFSALDTRVRAAIPNAGYITLEPRARYLGDIGDAEQNPSDLLTIADYSHLTAMLAPRRALLIYNAKDDCCFPAERAKAAVYDPILPLYEKLGLADAFRLHINHDPGTHNYERDNREACYRFLNRCFFPDGSRPDAEIPSDGEVRKPEELTVGLPGDNASFSTMAAALARDLPRDRCPTGDRAAVTAWQEQARARLRGIVRFKPSKAVWETVAQAPACTTPQGPAQGGSLQITMHRLRIGDDWTLPAVGVACDATEPKATTILIADAGRAGAEAAVMRLLADGTRVIALDVHLLGSAVPPGVPVWQACLLVSTVGERPLGVAAAQLLAAASAVKRERPHHVVTLAGLGRTAGIVALVAAALDPGDVDAVVAEDIPPTLKLLIADNVEYTACPHLFCFGLLERFDVRELVAMAMPRRVSLRPSGAPERVTREWATLDEIADALPAPRIRRIAGTSPPPSQPDGRK